MKKGFSINDVTQIGRNIHNLDESWVCFAIDTQDYPLIQYSMGKQDENGDWGVPELHDTFHADEQSIYSAISKS